MNPYKQCPNCGRQFPVTDVFCDSCGCPLDLIAPTQPQQPFVPPTQQPPAQATTVYAEKPKKTGVLIGLLVAILLVLAAMIVLGFFLIHQLNQNHSDPSELAAVAQTETTEMAAETDAPEHSLEPYILLWYVDDYWSLNDTSNDILKYYKPERIGYLCEFD